MKLFAQLLPPVIVGVAALWRIPAARVHHGQRLLCVSLLLLAIGMTLNVDQVYLAVDGAVGVPNGANLAGHIAGVLGVATMIEAISSVVRPGSSPRWRLALAVLAVAGLVASFAAAAVPVEATSFTKTYGHLPAIVVYWIITVGYIGTALAALGSMAWRTAAGARRAVLRAGMRVCVVGCACGLAWATAKIFEVTPRLVGRSAPEWLYGLDHVLLATTVPVLGLGLVLPALGATVARVRARGQRRRLARRIAPLWSDLVQLCPEVVLPRNPRRSGSAEDRLYRMVIETRDAILVLVPEGLPSGADGPADGAAGGGAAGGGAAGGGAAGDGAGDGTDPVRELGWCLRSAAVAGAPAGAGLFPRDVPASGSDDLWAEADYLARAADLWAGLRRRAVPA